jgi:hypothetical protein
MVYPIDAKGTIGWVAHRQSGLTIAAKYYTIEAMRKAIAASRSGQKAVECTVWT